MSVFHHRGLAVLNSILYAQDSIYRLLQVFDKWEVVISAFQEPSALPVPYCAIPPTHIREAAVPCEDHGLRTWGCFYLSVEGFTICSFSSGGLRDACYYDVTLCVLSFPWIRFYYFCHRLISPPFHTDS